MGKLTGAIIGLVVACVLRLSISVCAQSVTINPTSTYTAYPISMNTSLNTAYGGSYLLSNLLQVQSLMPQYWRQIISQPGPGSTTEFEGDGYDSPPVNFWAGGTILDVCAGNQFSGSTQICTGGAYGETGTITSNTSNAAISSCAISSDVATFTTPSSGASNTFVAGDTVIPMYFGGGCSFFNNVKLTVLSSGLSSTQFEANFTHANLSTTTDTGYVGPIYRLISPVSVAPAGYDSFVISVEQGNTASAWSTSGTVTYDTSSGDQPAAIDGFASPQCIDLAAGASITTAIDQAYGSYAFYQFNGNYTISTNAKTLSGTPTLKYSVIRSGGVDYTSGNLAVGSSYSTVSGTFTGSESGLVAAANVLVTIENSGSGNVCISNPSLTKSTDTSTYRGQVISDITSVLQTQGLRLWEQQSGATLLDLITPQAYRPTYGYSQSGVYNSPQNPSQGLHDFLTMAAANGIQDVEISVPVTEDPSQAANWADYFGAGSGTTYGAYRIALGQTTPWNQVFHQIILEYGNEIWNNGGFVGGGVLPAYSGSGGNAWNAVPLAKAWCSNAKAESWNSSTELCALGLQTATAGNFIPDVESSSIDLQMINQYMDYTTMTTCTNPAMWQSSYAWDWMATYDTSDVSGYQQAASSGMPAATYEGQYGLSGNCSTVQYTGLPEGQGGAAKTVLAVNLGQKQFGIKYWGFFTLFQYNTTTNSGATVAEWGAFDGSGGAYNNPRPAAYAIGMDNACKMLSNGTATAFNTSTTSIPSVTFSSINGVNSETYPALQFFGFESGNNYCLEAINADPANSHSFTINGTDAPTGTVNEAILSSANLTDSNESPNSSPVVTPTTSTPSGTGTFTIPGATMATISWSVGSTPSPTGFVGKFTCTGSCVIR